MDWYTNKEGQQVLAVEDDAPGASAVNVPRPRKHRSHEECSGVLVSATNEGQRDAVSRGRGTSSCRGLSGVVAGAGCSASLPGVGHSSRRWSNCVTYGLFSQLRCRLIVVISVRAAPWLRWPLWA